MPLDADEAIDAHLVTNRVAAAKDVDGLSIVNEGKVAVNDMADSFVPCTPAGCMDLIARSGVQVEGANAVVIGKRGLRMNESFRDRQQSSNFVQSIYFYFITNVLVRL